MCSMPYTFFFWFVSRLFICCFALKSVSYVFFTPCFLWVEVLGVSGPAGCQPAVVGKKKNNP